MSAALIDWPTPEEWADAMESGRYKRGQGHLRSKWAGQECFCPLGVLGDLAGIPYEYHADDRVATFCAAGLRETLILPSRPPWMTRDQLAAVWAANDRLGWDFNRTAEWVRSGMPVDTSTAVLSRIGARVAPLEVAA